MVLQFLRWVIIGDVFRVPVKAFHLLCELIEVQRGRSSAIHLFEYVPFVLTSKSPFDLLQGIMHVGFSPTDIPPFSIFFLVFLHLLDSRD